MLKIESYVGPIIESTLSKFIKLQPNALKISLWSGECKLKNLDLKLSTIEHELNLPFKLLNGSIKEIKVNIPWTALGSQSIVITCSTMEVTFELKETQKAELKDQLPEDSDDEFMDAVSENYEELELQSIERKNSQLTCSTNLSKTSGDNVTANTANNFDLTTERCQTSATTTPTPQTVPESGDGGIPIPVAAGEIPAAPNPGGEEDSAGYLENLINKIKHNIRVEINNFVVKYQEPEFVMRTTIQKLVLTAADEFWQPAFFDISSNEDLNFRQVCKIENLTINVDTRDPQTGNIDETFPDPFLSKTQLEIRIFNVFKSKRAGKPNLMKIDLLFEKVNIAIADKQLPIGIRLANLIIALYYREFTWERTPCPETSAEKGNEHENSWASWAMSMFTAGEEDDEKSQEDEEPLTLLAGIYFRKFSVWLKTKESDVTNVQKSGHHQETSAAKKPHRTSVSEATNLNNLNLNLQGEHIKSQETDSNHIPYVSVFNYDVEGVGIEITVTSNLNFYSCIAGVTHIRGRYCGGLPNYPLPMKSDSVTFLDMGIPVRKKTTYHYLSGSLFDYMAPENNSAAVECYTNLEDHKAYWTEEFFNRRFGAFFSDYVYILGLGW